MKNKKRNSKQANKTNIHSNNFFNNSILNRLNIEDLKQNTLYISNYNKENSLGKNLTSHKQFMNGMKTNNNFEKGINAYLNNCNKSLHFHNRNKTRTLKYINSSKDIKKNKNILYKKYLLGIDGIIPLKNVNNNIPFYLYDNSKKRTSYDPIKKNLKNNSKTLTNQKSFKTYYTWKSSDKRTKKKRNGKLKKKLFLDFKGSNFCLFNINKSNQNNLSNIYDSINFNNYSKKDILFKSNKTFSIKKTQFSQNNSSNIKSIKSINSFIPNEIQSDKKADTNIKTYNYINKSKSIYKNETNKSKETEDKKDEKERIVYDKIKKLIDEPSSFIYVMYNKMKRSKLRQIDNLKKISLKNKIREYKKEIVKLEQKARYQIFNLKKQVAIGAEDTIKGKIISTNTFFDLAFG